MKSTTIKLQNLSSSSSLPRRVVVTGLGLVTPLGSGVRRSYKRLLQGDHGFVPTESLGFTGPAGAILRSLPNKVVAAVPRDVNDPYSFNSSRVLDRATKSSSSPEFIAFAIAAAGEALLDAGFLYNPESHLPNGKDFVGNDDGTVQDVVEQIVGKKMRFQGGITADRFGVAIGSGIGNVEEIGAIASGLGLGISPHSRESHKTNSGNHSQPLEASAVDDEAYKAAIRKVSPYFVPRVLINMAGAHISMRFGLRGPAHAASTACTSGAHSIGDAFRLIKHGYADAMVAGGTEACIGPIAMTGFSRAKALSSSLSPEDASRPFDSARDGFVLGEGAGVLVLEELEQAKRRGARIYAEIKGYGLSSDAHHITSPPEDGHGALQSMRAALSEAMLTASAIDYVNAHATSTPTGDAIELSALSQLFLDQFGTVNDEALLSSSSSLSLSSEMNHQPSTAQLPLTDPRRIQAAKLFLDSRKGRGKVSVSSTKGSIGHLLGAAGAVEAIFSILSLTSASTKRKMDGGGLHNDHVNGLLPPTRNLTVIDKAAPIDICSFPSIRRSGTEQDPLLDDPTNAEIKVSLSNSFGFGGINTSLLFSSLF
jgi:3-oxoacyl-[acyl-carrier-protein] synthase II